MRVAVVHSYYSSDSPSGENQVVDAQIECLIAAGHDVLPVLKRTDEEAKSPLYPLKAAASAAGYGRSDPTDLIDRFDPHVVHVHNLFPNWGTSWVTRTAAPVVATMHNFRAVCASALLWRDGHDCQDCLTYSAVKAVEHKCYRNSVPATVPLAWATRSSGRHSPILNSASALVTLNPRATSLFRNLRPAALTREIPNFAAEFGALDAERQRDSWIFVGRLVPEKGVSWLLQNWPRSQKLTFVGSGPLAREVTRAVEEFPNVFRYKGQIEPDEVRDLIAGSVGLVIPSLWSEGVPTVALEALQAGTPIVISENCASASLLTADGAGETFGLDIGSDDLNACLNRLKASQTHRGNARSLYETHFSPLVWLEKIEALYFEVICN